MSIGPTIETYRLILRPPAAEDFEPWAAFSADPAVAQFIGGVVPRAMAWRGLCVMAGSWVINGFSMFSVIEKESGRWVGRLGPWMPEGWPGTEVGWGLARDDWGKGYAVEGAAAAIDWAFDALGWTEVLHAIDPANHRSQAWRADWARGCSTKRCCRHRSICRSRCRASRARSGRPAGAGTSADLVWTRPAFVGWGTSHSRRSGERLRRQRRISLPFPADEDQDRGEQRERHHGRKGQA